MLNRALSETNWRGRQRRQRMEIRPDTAPAMLVCLPGQYALEALCIPFDSEAEAIEADRLLLDKPCRRRCPGAHLIAVRVWKPGVDEDGNPTQVLSVKIRKSVHDLPPPDLEAELSALYLQRDDRELPPPDPSLNEPLLCPVSPTITPYQPLRSPQADETDVDDDWDADNPDGTAEDLEEDPAAAWLAENLMEA